MTITTTLGKHLTATPKLVALHIVTTGLALVAPGSTLWTKAATAQLIEFHKHNRKDA